MTLARLKGFARFWYDFIVGDDWRVALGVVLALVITYRLSHTTSVPLWWFLPAVVGVLLPLSIYRVTRRTTGRGHPSVS